MTGFIDFNDASRAYYADLYRRENQQEWGRDENHAVADSWNSLFQRVTTMVVETFAIDRELAPLKSDEKVILELVEFMHDIFHDGMHDNFPDSDLASEDGLALITAQEAIKVAKGGK